MTKPKSRIPEFKSVQEEAAFWDTHSFTDYLDEFKPVKVRFAKQLRHRLLLDFDRKTLTELETVADGKGIGLIALIQQWVFERLALEQSNADPVKQPKIIW